MQVSFKTTKKEQAVIDQIVARAKGMNKAVDTLSLAMDVTACHANGNPLRLQEMLVADDFNFAYDVFGISRHIDRTTGKMLDCFVPRFSKY